VHDLLEELKELGRGVLERTASIREDFLDEALAAVPEDSVQT
jgi:predicted nucleotidyltransferase